jgi:O-antigen/teichoic acid export membrane protein
VTPTGSLPLSSSRVVLRNALFNVGGFFVSSLYIFLLVPIALHFVGAENYGLWVIMMGLTGYFGLADLGLNTSLVKYISEYAAAGRSRDVNSVVWHGLLFYFVVSLVVFITGYVAFPLVFELLQLPAASYAPARNVFIISLLGFGVGSTVAIIGGVLLGLQRSDLYNFITNGLLILKLAGIAVALWLGAGIYGLALGDLAGGLLTIPLLTIAARKVYPALRFSPMRFDFGMIKKLLVFGVQLQVSRLAEVVQAQWDKLILTRIVGLSAVTPYDIGARPLSRIRTLPIIAVSALVPAVSALEVEQNRERIQSALLRSTRYLALFAAPAFTFVALFAPDLFTAWLGGEYPNSVLVARILSFALFMNVMTGGISFVSQGQGLPGFQMRAMLVQAIVNCVLSTGLAMLFGFLGAVTGTAIAVTTGSVVFIWSYGRTIVESPLRMFGGMALRAFLPLIPAIVFSIALRALVSGVFGSTGQWEAVLLLVVEGVAFVAGFGVGLRLARSVTPDDMRFLENAVPHRLKFILPLIARGL